MQEESMSSTIRRRLFRSVATVILLLTVDALFAFEEQWNDRAYGDAVEKDGVKIPNSLFRVDGEIWGAYEFVDRKPGGQIETNNGFRVGRTYINVRGDVKEGEYKGWGYRITIDSETGNQTPNGSPAIFMKMAYVQIPIVAGTSVRIGQQHVPVVDGQAGTSLQSIWGHRYLDADGKAMWEEFRVASSTDIGVSLIHRNRLFNMHLLLGNGEGYKSAGNGDGLSGKGQTNKDTIAAGDSKSYGLDLYGMLSMTPFARDEKEKGMLTIAFPFRFQNVVGVQRREYDNVTEFNPAANTFKAISGEKRALQDYAYGTEIDLTFKTDAVKLTVGAGTVIKVDRRANTLLFDEKIGTLDPTNNADLKTFFTTNYVRASDSRGQGNYAFIHGRTGKFGLVARYSTGTGTGSLSEKLGVVNGVSTTERLIIEDIKAGNGIDGNFSSSTFRNLDQGRSRLKKTLFAVTYNPDARFSVALGISYISGQGGNGEAYRVNRLSGIDKYDTSTSTFAGVVAPGTIVTDNDLLGEKNFDQKTFIRMVLQY